MRQIALAPTARPPVEFHGELMVAVDGQDPDDQTGGRCHDIAIYHVENGDLAVVIAYRTAAAGESEHCTVEMAQNADDVDEILSLYDPKSMVVLTDDSSQRRLAEHVVRHYDLAVNDVLSRLQEIASSDSTPSQPR